MVLMTLKTRIEAVNVEVLNINKKRGELQGRGIVCNNNCYPQLQLRSHNSASRSQEDLNYLEATCQSPLVSIERDEIIISNFLSGKMRDLMLGMPCQNKFLVTEFH